MLVGHRCLFKPSHADCQPLGVGGLAEDWLEIRRRIRRRIPTGELETSQTELCSGGVCAAASLDSWEVFGTFSMFWERTGEGAVEGSRLGCWHACALLEDGKVSASPCPAGEQHLQDVSSKGLF